MIGNIAAQQTIESIGDTLVLDNGTVSKCVYNKDKAKWRIVSLNVIKGQEM
jgi:hypothetical protein